MRAWLLGGDGPLVYRQSVWTRGAHWTWALAMLFLLGSGLQIFNAHPVLYIGAESGFDYDNAILRIGAVERAEGLRGVTEVAGRALDTTGVLGLSGDPAAPRIRAFPEWATIPSGQSLATGRVVHFFFAWVFVGAFAVWAVAGLWTGHIRRDLAPRLADLAALPREIADHARLRLHRTPRYGAPQKLSYGAVLFVLFPLMLVTGLAMSPAMNAALPWLPEVLGGRQTARTLHFAGMLGIAAFTLVHLLMVLLAGPFNELRSMVTGWYRADAQEADHG